MAVEFERLVVYMDARLADYERALAKARGQTQKQLTDIEKRFQTASSKISGFGRAFAGALGFGLGATSLVAAGFQALKLADSLDATSKALGISTDNLQALQFAANKTGVEVGELDSAMNAFARALGDAASGEQSAIDKFEALGVAINDAQGRARSLPAVLEDVAKAIGNVGNEQQQLAALADLFGRSGVRLLPLLSELSGGFGDLTDAAREAGQVMSSETVKALADANDAIDALKNRIVIATGEIIIAISGMPSALAEATAEMAKQAEASGITIGNALAEAALAMVPPELQRIIQGAPGRGPETGIFGPASQSNVALPPVKSGSYNLPSRTGAGAADRAAAEAKRAAEARVEALRLLAEELELQSKLIASYGQGAEALEALREAYDALADARKLGFEAGSQEEKDFLAGREQLQTLRQQLDMLAEGASLTAQVRTEEEMRADAIERLNELRAAGVITEETYNRALVETNERLAEMRGLAEDVTGALADGILNAIQNGEGLKGVLDSISQSLGNIANQLLNKALSKLFDLAFDSIFGAGGGGGVGTGLGASSQGFLHFGGPRASGGNVEPGRAYLVGERRPELFVPNVPGRIETSVRGAGGGVAPLVQFINNVPDTVHREERSQENGRETLRIFLDQATARNIARSGTATKRTLEASGVRAPLARR